MVHAWQPYCLKCFHFKLSSAFHVALWSVLCTGLLPHSSLSWVMENPSYVPYLFSSQFPLIHYTALLSYGQQSCSLPYSKSRYAETWDCSSLSVQFHLSDKSNCITSAAALMCPSFRSLLVTLFYVINNISWDFCSLFFPPPVPLYLGYFSPNSYSIREERTTQIHSLKEKCIKVNILAQKTCQLFVSRQEEGAPI